MLAQTVVDKFGEGGIPAFRQVMRSGSADEVATSPIEVTGVGGAFQIRGGFVGTVTFEESATKTGGYTALTVYPTDGTAPASTTTAAGIFWFVRNLRYVRARISEYTSGAVNVRYTNLTAGEIPATPAHQSLSSGSLERYRVPAAAATVASPTGIHAAVTDTGVPVTVTTGITQPSVPRNITATAGGTAGDIKAIQVVINGTDAEGAVISETLPAFTVDTPGAVAGSKAFASVTSIVIPAHDGTGATTAIGFGEKLGLPDRLSLNSVLAAFHNSIREATAPTVVVDPVNLSGNTVDLNTALNSSVIDILYFRV